MSRGRRKVQGDTTTDELPNVERKSSGRANAVPSPRQSTSHENCIIGNVSSLAHKQLRKKMLDGVLSAAWRCVGLMDNLYILY
jgi:hypothetical protein